MKIILVIFITIIIIGLIYFFYLGYKSQTGTARGLVNSKLSPCAKKPNCICTEYPDDKTHFSDAIKYESVDNDNIIKAIETTGGKITELKDSYIAATYTSGLFKYVDDFEVRIDTQNRLIHIRSASRVGHSDMGVNLKRVENFKRVFKDILLKVLEKNKT